MAIDSHFLEVTDVIAETADAKSIVFEVPAELQTVFSYTSGQFLTVAVPSDKTGLVARCYSLASAPNELQHKITVKRTVDGYASNWLCDNLKVGDKLRILPPSGIFTPKTLDNNLLLFAAGSGITPIISIAKTMLATGTKNVVLFYANRDDKSVIFAEELRQLDAQYGDRLVVVHWLESVQGLPTAKSIRTLASYFKDWEAFCCGPAPFMSAVAEVLKGLDFPRSRRHQEKFVSLGGNPFGDVAEIAQAEAEIHQADDFDASTDATITGPVKLEVELDGEQFEFTDWPGNQKMLDFLESKGVAAPFSCREGNCSACACIVLEGDLRMLHNEALEAEDIADGIRLTCQSVALTEAVKISFNG